MYVRTGDSGMAGVSRRRGMGDIDPRLQVGVPGQYSPIDPFELSKMREVVAYFGTRIARFKGIGSMTTGQANPYGGGDGTAKIIGDRFEQLVNLSDITNNDVAKVNRAGNEAIRWAVGDVNNLPAGLRYNPSWELPQYAWHPIDKDKYSAVPYCEDTGNGNFQSNMADCQAMQQILTRGDYNFAQWGGGDGNLHLVNKTTGYQPPAAPASVNGPSQAALDSLYVPPGSSPASPPQQQVQPVVIFNDPAPAPTPTMQQSTPVMSPFAAQVGSQPLMSPPGQVASQLKKSSVNFGNQVQTVNQNTGLPAASGALDSAMAWVSANPLLAAGAALGLFFAFGGMGRR